MPINPEQVEAVLKLPAKERYGHFIKRVADFEEAWGLRCAAGGAAASGLSVT